MNILGMGALEILVIALLAFILLGPQKMLDAARLLGKASREIRRMADEMPQIVIDDEADGGVPPSTPDADRRSEERNDGAPTTREDAPVSFRRSKPPASAEENGNDKALETDNP